MELIERYLYAVGKKLPLKQKDDITKELRSIIMDNLDDIKTGEEPSDDEIMKVLKDMGSPNEVAKRYRTGPSWIIGPKYYDVYILIVKIVLAVTAGAYLLSLIISMFTLEGNFGARLWYVFKELFDIVPGLMASIGSVTLVFAIIERLSDKKIDIDMTEDKNWDPKQLEPIPDKSERVKPIESILAIVFSVFAIIVLNVYREKLGLYFISDMEEGWKMVRIFSIDALDVYSPLWTIALALDIALYGFLLKTGKHTFATKIFEMGTKAFNIWILFFIANGPVLFEFGGNTSQYVNFKPVVEWLAQNQNLIFTILAVLSILGLLTMFIKLMIKKFQLRSING